MPSGTEFDRSSPLKSFVNVVRRLVLHPVKFFAEVPRARNILDPLLFALICFEVSRIAAVLPLAGDVLGGSQTAIRAALWSVVGVVIIGIICLPIVASFLQFAAGLVVGEENTTFGAAFRVIAYAQVIHLVSWIPVIGPLSVLYAVYLLVVGIRETRGTTTRRAVLVFVGYCFLLFPFFFVLVLPLASVLARVFLF
jgi:hypothetical protein